MTRLAIGAIFRNEGPYILEWIAYHQAIGVDHFIIADNDSEDGSSRLLRRLEKCGVVTRFRVPGKKQQIRSYDRILRECSADIDWIAFIDADEFLVPQAGLSSVKPLIERAQQHSDIGAILVNWACYGSSGRDEPGSGGVLSRFTMRAEKHFGPNRHYKSIVRPRAARCAVNAHHFDLREGFHAILADGSVYENKQDEIQGMTRDGPIWEPVRINHYVVKSRQEFWTRKQPRGRAEIEGAGGYRDTSFFDGHDRNEVVDPVPKSLIAATRRKQFELRLRLLMRFFRS